MILRAGSSPGRLRWPRPRSAPATGGHPGYPAGDGRADRRRDVRGLGVRGHRPPAACLPGTPRFGGDRGRGVASRSCLRCPRPGLYGLYRGCHAPARGGPRAHAVPDHDLPGPARGASARTGRSGTRSSTRSTTRSLTTSGSRTPASRSSRRTGHPRPGCHTPAVDAHILLVEDDPSIREVTALGLRGAGFTVTTARTAPRAWSAGEPGRRTSCCWTSCCRASTASRLSRDPARGHDAHRHTHSTRRHDRRRRRPGVRGGRLRAQALRDARACRPRAGRPPPPAAGRRCGVGRPRPAGAAADRHGGRTVDRDGRDIALTRTEFDLLAELARSPGQVFTRDMLLDRVWGYDYLGDSRLVDVAVGRLRARIETDPASPELVLTVRGAGYKAARQARRRAPWIGIRARLALTLIALVAVTVAAIGVGVYAFVDASCARASSPTPGSRWTTTSRSSCPGPIHSRTNSRPSRQAACRWRSRSGPSGT